MIEKPAIIKLYLSGLSSREIAAQTGYSKSYIARICRGVSRSQSESLKLRFGKRPPSKHWRTCRANARAIWEKENGPIPDKHVIHHKDEDFTNNALENLECIPVSIHISLHHSGPERGIPRHLRPARQAYMKTYLKEYRRASKA